MAKVKRKIVPLRNLQKSGIQILNLQAAGGVANDGVTFEFKNYIEVYSYQVISTCYMWFPDIATATLLNSIVSSTTSVGAAVPTINANQYRFLMSAPAIVNLSSPIVCKQVGIFQASASAAVVTLFYKNYIP